MNASSLGSARSATASRSDSPAPTRCSRSLKKPAASRRTRSPPRVDYTRGFLKDWERLSRSDRYDMYRLKAIMLNLIANEAPLGAALRPCRPPPLRPFRPFSALEADEELITGSLRSANPVLGTGRRTVGGPDLRARIRR